jgi:hypothetical protein
MNTSNATLSTLAKASCGYKLSLYLSLNLLLLKSLIV